MPQEPKRRHSRQRKGKRRAGIILKTPEYVSCGNCGQPTLPHRVCKNCGFYKGRQVLTFKAEKKEKENEKSS